MSRLHCLLALALTLAACDAPGVSLIVAVRSDLVAGLEVDSFEVQLPDDAVAPERQAVVRGDELAQGIRVAAWDGLLSSGSRRVTVHALLDGARVATRSAIVENREPLSVTLVMARECTPGRCEVSRGCLDGRCVESTCLTGEEPSCPLTCEGCVAQSACDDARCESGACLHFADDDACALTEVCAPGEGCVPSTPPDDAGPRDAGPLGDAGGDAGPLADGGPVDAGANDAGASDAGAGDAGASDAGADAGPDAGRDAGSDAGPLASCRNGGACDYIDQDCGGVSQGCVPRPFPLGIQPLCATVSSSNAANCVTDGDCRQGFTCTAEGCRQVCCPPGFTTCGVGETCRPSSAGGFGLCLPNGECDVLAQVGCDAGDACYPQSTGGQCFSEGATTIAQACEFDNDCRAGQRCVDDRCRRACDRATEIPCAASETCAPINNSYLGDCVRSGCDPVAQTGCTESGTACYPSEDAIAGCFVEGTLPLGASCGGESFNVCVGGTSCAGGVCRTICELGAGTCDCASVTGQQIWGVCV